MEFPFYMGIALFHAFVSMTHGATIRQIIDQHEDLIQVFILNTSVLVFEVLINERNCT